MHIVKKPSFKIFFAAFIFVFLSFTVSLSPLLDKTANAASVEENFKAPAKGCTVSGGDPYIDYQSTFSVTKGMCVGHGSHGIDSSTSDYYFFQIEVKFAGSVKDATVSAKNGKGESISFIPTTTNNILFVSNSKQGIGAYHNSDGQNIGYSIQTPGKQCDSNNNLNSITISETGNGGNDSQKIDLCTFFNQKTNGMAEVNVTKIIPDSGSSSDLPGAIRGLIGISRTSLPSNSTLPSKTPILADGIKSMKLASTDGKGVSLFTTVDSAGHVNGNSWYNLATGGSLTIGSLKAGTYALEIHYNDLLAEQMSNDSNISSDPAVVGKNLSQDTTISYASIIVKPNADTWITSKTDISYTDSSTSIDKTVTTTTTCAIEGIGWIVCPIVRFLGGIVDGSWNILQGFLQTSPSIVKTGDITYKAWQSVLNIANVAFVILFLVIIFSQLTNFGINNYGIKKMLPRLIIAAILVNVSFYICQIAVDLSNIFGFSIKSILDNLVNNSSSAPNLFLGGGTAGGTSSIIGGILGTVGAGAIAYAALGILIPVLIAGIVAVVLILFLLISRQALIILLVVISPLAFVAFLLPNTEKLYKSWQKMFVSMLLLFPIVALIMGTASMASSILSTVFVGTTTGSSSWIGQIAAAAVSILPLFVVPGLLKKSLDGVGTIGAKLNGLATKTSGSVGKYASEKSRLGQFAKYKSSERDRTRNLIQSGVYSGKNPFHNVSSKINKAYNEGPLSGSFGARSAASGLAMSNKIEDEQISNAAALYKSQKGPEWPAASTALDYESAVKNNDAIKALALQGVLRSSGAPGLEALHKSLESLESNGGFTGKDGLRLGIKRDILSAGLKGKDAGLNQWSYSSSDKTLSDISKASSTFTGLTDTELSGQSKAVLTEATKNGGNFVIDAKIAKSILGNQTTSANLGRSSTREFFENALPPTPTSPIPSPVPTIPIYPAGTPIPPTTPGPNGPRIRP